MRILYRHNLTSQELRHFNALCKWLDIAINVITFVHSAYEHMYPACGQRENCRAAGSAAWHSLQ